MAETVAKRLAEHLERSGFVMKRPEEIGAGAMIRLAVTMSARARSRFATLLDPSAIV